MSVSELFPEPGHTQLPVDYFEQPQAERLETNPRCADCPARLYAEENARLIDDAKGGIETAESRAWRKFGDGLMQACKAGEPTIKTGKKFAVIGEPILIVDCASKSAEHHPRKITRRKIAQAPIEDN